MRSIFVLLVLFSTVEGSPNTVQAILDRARQRTLSGTALKKSRRFTAEYDDLLRDVVTSYSGDEKLSKLYNVFTTLLSHLGMDTMSQGRFYQRAGEVRRSPSNTLTNKGASEPSDPVSCFIVTDPQRSAGEPENFHTVANLASFVRDDEDQFRATSSEALVSARKENSPTLLKAKLGNEEVYRMLLERARLRIDTQPASSRRVKKYTLAHDQLIMDVVNYFKSATSSGKYEIYDALASELGMVKMERNTFIGRAYKATKSTGGDCAKQNKREPKIALEARRILDSLFQKNPKLSINEAWEAFESLPHHGVVPRPSIQDVRNRLQDLRATHRFAVVQQLDVEEGIAPGEVTLLEEERVEKFTAGHEDSIMDVVESCSGGESVSRQYELLKTLSLDFGLVDISRGVAGAPQKRSETTPDIGKADSEILHCLFERNLEISQGAALKVPRGTDEAEESSGDEQIVSSNPAIPHFEEFQGDDAHDWSEIAFMLAEKQEDDVVPLRIEEEDDADLDLLKEISFVLADRWEDEVDKECYGNSGSRSALANEGPGERTGSDARQKCGKRKRDD